MEEFGRSWKREVGNWTIGQLGNFYGRHMCIVPYLTLHFSILFDNLSDDLHYQRELP